MYVTSLDMKRPNDNCPSQFKQEIAGGKRLCVKTAQTGCSSHTYSTGGMLRCAGRQGDTNMAHLTLNQTHKALRETMWTGYPSLMDLILVSTFGRTWEDLLNILW